MRNRYVCLWRVRHSLCQCGLITLDVRNGLVLNPLAPEFRWHQLWLLQGSEAQWDPYLWDVARELEDGDLFHILVVVPDIVGLSMHLIHATNSKGKLAVRSRMNVC